MVRCWNSIKHEGHGKSALVKLGYAFDRVEINVPDTVYSIHIEGDAVVDIVAAEITIAMVGDAQVTHGK